MTWEQNFSFSLLSNNSCKYVFGLFANTNARKLTRAARQQQEHKKKPHGAVDIKISHPKRENREKKHEFFSKDLGGLSKQQKHKEMFHSEVCFYKQKIQKD
ncbi:hypothetical protein XENOCAPTIV_011549 [Xenoophorus captivus]|uniref:Uncharacterized protein n=1 Tax=Xenoophorus captivus TaxID=1517983 RepID=A0ABV0QV96_9TELE